MKIMHFENKFCVCIWHTIIFVPSVLEPLKKMVYFSVLCYFLCWFLLSFDLITILHFKIENVIFNVFANTRSSNHMSIHPKIFRFVVTYNFMRYQIHMATLKPLLNARVILVLKSINVPT